jgi:hypothetical protein
MVKRSTTETRYSAAPISAKKSKLKEKVDAPVKKKKRSAKTYLKKSSKEFTPKKSSPQKVPLKSIKKDTAAKLQPTGLKRSAEGRSLRPKEFYVGEITHYFAKISVVVVKVAEHPLLIGDQIHIKGSAEFSQKVQSLQVESKDVRFARRGELVGLQVTQPAKPGDKVFKTKK